MMNDMIMDVHGAGCQRSDPKSGNPEDYPQYLGPQGDIRYVYNFVRCVRNIDELKSGDYALMVKFLSWFVLVSNLKSNNPLI